MQFLIAMLLLLLGSNVTVTIVDNRTAFNLPVGDGRYVLTPGYAICFPDGTSQVVVAKQSPVWMIVLAGELAHAYDCLDDGIANGSPQPGMGVEEYSRHVVWTGEIGGPQNIKCWNWRCSMQRRVSLRAAV